MKKNKNEDPGDFTSFMKFMLSRENKYQLLAFIISYIVLYFILVKLYPYPAGISDSGSYVMAASMNSPDTYRPFGYSKFLRGIHELSPSIHFLILTQFFINAICTLFLLFTVKYFFPVKRKIIYYSFAVLAIVSPLILYLSNSVLSDSLFTSLTMLWLGTGLWMVYAGENKAKYIFYVAHLLFLFFLISIRYTGLVYAPVSMLFVFISYLKKSLLLRISLVSLVLLIVFGIYRNQKATIKSMVHVDTFSGFSGWQMASNALNCVPYIDLKPAQIRDKKVKEFARFAMEFDTLLIMKTKPSAKYMWDNRLPLKSYCFYEAQRTNTSYIYQWNYLGANVYGKFGSFIMKKYPFAYARHYFLPNCRLIFYPTDDQVIKRFRTDWIPDDLLKRWFGFRAGEKLHSKSSIFENIFFLIPISRAVLWTMLLVCLIAIVLKRKQLAWQTFQKATVLLIFSFILIYYAFSAYAGPFELRYMGPVHVAIVSLIYIALNDITFHKETN